MSIEYLISALQTEGATTTTTTTTTKDLTYKINPGKWVAIPLIFFIILFACFLPHLLLRLKKGVGLAIALCTCLSGGALLGIGLMHILPHAEEYWELYLIPAGCGDSHAGHEHFRQKDSTLFNLPTQNNQNNNFQIHNFEQNSQHHLKTDPITFLPSETLTHSFSPLQSIDPVDPSTIPDPVAVEPNCPEGHLFPYAQLCCGLVIMLLMATESFLHTYLAHRGTGAVHLHEHGDGGDCGHGHDHDHHGDGHHNEHSHGHHAHHTHHTHHHQDVNSNGGNFPDEAIELESISSSKPMSRDNNINTNHPTHPSPHFTITIQPPHKLATASTDTQAESQIEPHLTHNNSQYDHNNNNNSNSSQQDENSDNSNSHQTPKSNSMQNDDNNGNNAENNAEKNENETEFERRTRQVVESGDVDEHGKRLSKEDIEKLRVRRTIDAYISALAISLHCAFNGLSLGVFTASTQSDVSSFWTLFGATVGHKLMDGFAVGIPLMRANLGLITTIIIAIFVAGSTPIGILVGYFASNVKNNSRYLAQAILMSLSSGSFFYISLLEMIPNGVKGKDWVWLKWFTVGLGFAISAIIAKWA
jgi:zinc transporter ZupT